MKVLFITSSRLGDAILSTSVLHYLETKYPRLDVTVVCGGLPADLFRSIPFCSNVIVIEKKSFSRHWFDLWKQTYARKWDKVIDLRGSLLSYFLKTRTRSRWQKNLCNEGHQVERLQRLMGVSYPIAPKLWLEGDYLKKAKTVIQNPTLVVAPTANWMGKQWPADSFIGVLRQFLAKYPEHHEILLVAAPHEGKVLKYIQHEIASTRVKTLLSSDLGYVACCLSQCDMFLGNDSGLMHMAAALGIPTIGLFGPSDDTRYGPYGPGISSSNVGIQDYHILRIPMSLADLEKTPGFSYSASTCYMTTLPVKTVWNTLHRTWETIAC